MTYRLNEDWLDKNPQGVVKMPKLKVSFDLSTKAGRDALLKNKKALEMLCKYKAKYVICDKEECCNEEAKCSNNNKIDGIKEKTSREKTKQVSAKASKKK